MLGTLCRWALMTCVIVGGVIGISAVDSSPPAEYLNEFSAYVIRFNKTYPSTKAHDKAYSAFVFNMKEVEALNHKAKIDGSEVLFSLSENSDFYITEKIISFPPLKERPHPGFSDLRRPLEDPIKGMVFSWQGSKRVTSVKNQGQCGSCYIFAAAAVLGSVINSGMSVSEQQVLDCAAGLGKCNGGWPHEVLRTMSYLYSKRGWEYDTVYPPYVAQPQTCMYSSSASMYLYSLTGTYVNSVSTSTLISLILNRGVIAIAVSVNNAFYQYSSGILTQMLCPNGGVNHAVAAVGYGTDSNGKYYFIIKNSWGPSWGQFGYVYIYTDACNMRYYAAYLD